VRFAGVCDFAAVVRLSLACAISPASGNSPIRSLIPKLGLAA
jgi:hypothetical protein